MSLNLQVGVKIFLKNKDNKYLLLKRSTKKYKNTSGVWDIVGGRIEPGTSLIENLRREVKEETQLNLVDEVKLVAVQDIIKKDLHVARVTYLGTIEGEPILDSDHDTYKWLSFLEMKSLEDLDIYVKELIENKIVSDETSS